MKVVSCPKLIVILVQVVTLLAGGIVVMIGVKNDAPTDAC